MMFRLLHIGLLLACLLAAAAPAVSAEGITLTRLQTGKPTGLEYFRGAPVLLAFWRSDCPPCRTEEPIVLEIAKAHPDLHIALVSLQDKTTTLKHFPKDPARNIRVFLVGKDAHTTLAALGDVKDALPFSAMLHADGTSCARKHGLLGTDIADKWVKKC